MKKFYLSNANKKIAGVCGGLGEYLDVDPTVWRVIFLISCFLGGLGLIVYLVMWLVVPRNPKHSPW